MKLLFAVSLAALTTACVVGEPVDLSPEDQGELSAALRGRVAGPPLNCVPQRNLRGSRSIGEGAILFQGNNGMAYVNRPRSGCPIITQSKALITQTPSTQLCQGDIVNVVDPVANFSFGSCALGEFIPYRRVR